MKLPTRMQARGVYLLLAMMVMLAGLASRRYRNRLPLFIGTYSGDTLWGLMLYLLISALADRRSIWQRAWVAIAIAFAIECSQLYHAPWIDGIRQTTLGGLVLGFEFLWSDLVCYLVGIALGAVAERAVVERGRVKNG